MRYLTAHPSPMNAPARADDRRDPHDPRRGLRTVQRALLAGTFLATAGYEAVEARLLEASQHGPLALALHSLQVLAILAATWTVIRAWRERDRHEAALGRMVERVIFAQEEERRRVAYELHDAISPLIVGARMHVDTSREVRVEDPARAEVELARGAERLQQALVELRHVLRALRPSSLDAEGLAAAVRRSLDESAVAAGWTVQFDENLGDDRLPPAVEAAAFRIVQEALANATRHARADRVEVALRRDDDALDLAVRDHGVGVSDAPTRGLGLDSMKERARLLGGACSVEGAAGEGTVVRARLPLRVEAV